MKKSLSLIAAAVAAGVFCGCTTVESTQKFNRMGLGTPNEKAVCQTFVEIPGIFFFELPIVVGSPAGDGEWTMFRYNLTADNVIHLLTKEAKARKAARVVNVQISAAESTIFPFPLLLTRRTIQASGTGVRTKGAAVERAASEYDAQP
ncbi:MAG: hypothetical protein MR051_06410 [Lentisphaeria bacterium]|nr:hypothetical protein [Lentisphaeria bacterium]